MRDRGRKTEREREKEREKEESSHFSNICQEVNEGETQAKFKYAAKEALESSKFISTV